MSTVITAKRFGLIAAALAILTTVLVSMVAFFTARANETVSFTVSHFAKDGYAMERTAPDDYFLAGESVTTKIKESNTEDSDIRATLTMSAVWNSPDPNSKLWSSDNSESNAALTLDGDPISYAVQADGSITFDLPAVSLSASQSIERDLVLKIPDSLKGTGTVTFSFDKAIVKGTNASWSNTYSREDLNGQEDLSYAIPVAWNISKNQSTKDLIAYLTDSEGQYGLEIIKNGKSINTNNSEMMDFSIDKTKAAHDITQWSSGAPWYSYRSDLISVSMPDELTTIGDGAFLNLSAWTIQQLTVGEHVSSVGEAAFGNVNAITSVTIPKSVMSIESQAFGSLPNTDTFTFAHGTGDILSLPDNTDGNGAFHVGDPYSQNNPRETRVIYKIEAVREYNWGGDNRGHLISIEERTGGTMTADRTVAIGGQEINLTATPEGEYMYNGATYVYEDENGNEQTMELAKDVLSFTMPENAVTVTPKWLAPPILAKTSTWYSQGGTSITRPSFTSITLVDSYDVTGKTIIDQWDASDASVPGTVTAYVEDDGSGNGTYKLTISGNGYGFIYANPTSSSVFGYADLSNAFTAVTAINGLDLLNTTKATTMNGMFYGCKSLNSLDVSGFVTDNVTDMASMFASCTVIEKLDLSSFYTGKVENMNSMFANCTKLRDLNTDGFNTSNVIYMGSMFNYCEALTELDLTHFDTGSVKDMKAMFYGCKNLTSLNISSFVTSNVTDMKSMFHSCESLTSLNVSSFDTQNVKTMWGMFRLCKNINDLDLSNFNTTKVTNMWGMFASCYSLTNVDLSSFSTSKVDDMGSMFSSCQSLTSLDLNTFDMSNVSTMEDMFYETYKLDTVTLGEKFAFAGTDGYLLEPDKTYIPGATGNWYSIDEWVKYTPAQVASVHGGKSVTYTAYPPALDSIHITTAPDKVEYEVGENFDPTGMVVKASFAHDRYPSFTKTLADDAYTVLDGDNLQEGTTKVTVSYTDTYYSTAAGGVTKTDDQPITVTKAEVLPILGKQTDAWGGSTSSKRNVTEISFVDSYTPTGDETSTWDASDPSVPGTVTGYMLADTANSGKYKVIFAGNGSGVIYANPNSSGLFYNANNLATINGLDFLDTSKTTDMRSMFERCWKLKNPAIGGWDVSNVTDFSDMFNECRHIQRLSLPNWDVSSAKDMSNMFDTCGSLISIDISSWDVSNVEDMSYMFYDCHQLPSIDLNNWNTQNVTTMKSMFSTCTALTSVGASNWNTAKVTDMSSMFWNCAALQTIDVSKWDTGNVTTMRGMFYNYNYNRVLTSLDVSNWDTGNVTTMELMFSYCTALTTLDVSDWDTSSLTNLKETFRDTALTNLDVSNWDVSNVTTLYLTFSNCGELQSLPVGNWDISNVTTLHGTFDACASLTSLDVGKWDTSNVTDMERLFYSNRMLTSLDVSTKTVTSNGKTYTAWDTGKVINMSYMFFDCEVLTKLDLSDWKTGNVATMLSMFDSCFALSSLDMTGWDTSQVTNMSRMFWTCSSLTSLDVSDFNTSAVVNMSNMFNSIRVTTLDLSNFDTSAVTNMSNMFQYANRLTSLDISNFDFTSVTSSDDIFTRSSDASSTYKIYVKDATAQAWVQGQASLPSYATVTIKAAALNTLSLDTEETIEKDSSAQSAEESSPKTSEEVSIVADEETIPLQDEVDPPLDEIDPPLEVTEVEPTSEYSDNSDSLDLPEEPDEEESITE